MINRQQAYNLMREWVKSESLRKHMLCVEAAMRAYARKFGEDEEMWELPDYSTILIMKKYPNVDAAAKTGHPFEGVRELQRLEFPQEIVTAILGHALYSGVPRESNMAKCLFACDELCGFLVACAYMRPDKFESLTVESVKKKLKDKKFAAKVSREDIALGVQELAVSDLEHINFVINSLRLISAQIF